MEKTKRQKTKYPKSSYWCLTINFDVTPELEDDILYLNSILSWMPLSTYVVYQIEKVQHYHIQMYIEFSRQVRLSHLRKNWKWKSVPHCEVRKGSRQQAIDYCQKLDSRVSGPYILQKTQKVTGVEKRSFEVPKVALCLLCKVYPVSPNSHNEIYCNDCDYIQAKRSKTEVLLTKKSEC